MSQSNEEKYDYVFFIVVNEDISPTPSKGFYAAQASHITDVIVRETVSALYLWSETPQICIDDAHWQKCPKTIVKKAAELELRRFEKDFPDHCRSFVDEFESKSFLTCVGFFPTNNATIHNMLSKVKLL